MPSGHPAACLGPPGPVYRSLIYALQFFSWCRVAHRPLPFTSFGLGAMSLARSLCVLALSLFCCQLVSPAVSCFLLALPLLVSSAGPFWGTHFSDRGRSRTSVAVVCCGVGVRWILCQLGVSHTQGLSALSPSCQVGCVLAVVFLLFMLTYSLLAWSFSPSILLMYTFHNPPSHPTRIHFSQTRLLLWLCSYHCRLSPLPLPLTYLYSPLCLSLALLLYCCSCTVRVSAVAFPNAIWASPATCPRATCSRYATLFFKVIISFQVAMISVYFECAIPYFGS